MTENSQAPAFNSAGYLQFDVKAGEIDANLESVRQGLAGLAAELESPAIIVLPELWATGFAYSRLPDLAAATPDLLAALQKLAGQHIMAGSLPEIATDNGRTSYYNTLYITGPEGVIASYRKQHLFAPMQEDTFFRPGGRDKSGPLNTPAGSLAGLVCYDLRFPELARQQTAAGADLLIISAQWPKARVDHWQTLVQARAIENQLYVIACNRCGATGDTVFAGHSLIVAPDGEVLRAAGEEAASAVVRLDHAVTRTVRGRFNTVSAP